MTTQRGTLRVAVIDRDAALLKVLGKRFDAAGWEHRVLPGGAPVEDLVAMKLNALVVDITLLGPEDGWSFIGRVSEALPELALVVCTSSPTVAQRVRGLRAGADDWIAKPCHPEEGWSFIGRVSEALPELALVVCTSSPTVAQRVRGLRAGADDWIGKPCHPEEVIARIEAIVRRRRRARPEIDAGPVVIGELEIRQDQFQAFVAGEALDLTRREFELLNTLADAAGKVLEREEIYRRVWGYEMAHGDRSVDVFVRKLRSKIQKHSPEWNYIHTHFGIGYRFEAVGEDAPDGAAATRASVPAPDETIEVVEAEWSEPAAV